MDDIDECEKARKTMFDLLKQGGYDRVEADYDGYGDSGQIGRVAAYKGAAEVTGESLPDGVREAVEDYLYATLGDSWGNDAGSYGTLRAYTASEYATISHAERSEEWSHFEDGEPGPDVPDHDRW